LPDLPRPTVSADVKTEVEAGKPFTADVTITRDNKAKSYTGGGSSASGAVKDVVEKILNDPYSAEWLP
jgi:hypothetical protein